MNGARLHKKHIVRLNRHPLQIPGKGAVPGRPPDRFGIQIPAQSINEGSIPGRIQHIPHFRFAPLALFPGEGVGVRGMDLNGQVLFGIDELYEDGQPTVFFRMGTQKIGILAQHIPQALPGIFPAGHHRGTIRVGGALPGFRQRGKGQSLREIRFQPVPAPEIILPGRGQEEWFTLHKHPVPAQISLCRPR